MHIRCSHSKGVAIVPLPSPPRPEYEAVFDAVPGNYLLLRPDFTIVGVTEAYLAATMTVRDQILGRGLFDVFPDNPDDPAADGTRNLRASLLRVLASRRPDRMPVQKYDIPRPEAQGGGFEERYWSPFNSPVAGPDGTVKYIVHCVEDVTEFIRLQREMQHEQAVLQEELRARASKIEAETFLRIEAVEASKRVRESERRYRFLADAVPQLIWTADTSGLLDYCNERWVTFTGLSLDRLRGNGWQEALHPDDRRATVAAWSEAVSAGTGRYQVEHRMRHHDGTWRWMLAVAVPYRDANGVVHTWLGTTTDIHDRVTAEEQVRETQRLQAVGKLAGGVAHEVNNMMSVVMGFGELVLDQLEPDQPERDDIAAMVRAAERATAVTGQLLAFSRQQVLKPVVVDVNLVVSELTPTLQRVLGSDRRLEVISRAPRPRVVIDRTQIEQVLINLVANARDATKTNGLVMVETSTVQLDGKISQPEGEPGPFVRLAIRDDGVGMSPEVLARAFEPFFTTKLPGKGTGLGLSMVHGVIRQSGGQVHIDSPPGGGTTVAVYLPLVEHELTPPEPARSAPRGAGETILVVEDEPVVRSLALRVLESQGYIVYQAPNGAAALEFLVTHPGEVDLVLTDIVMPRLNGRELAERLAETAPDLPVLFMSGYSDDEILHRGVLPGGATLIPKPITPEALSVAVRDRLARSRSLGQAHAD
jgi:PAS domain S-box-containing protein